MKPEFTSALADTATDRGSAWYDDFQRCARSHALAQVIELRTPARKQAFEVGKLVHSVLRYASTQEIAGADWSDWELLLNAAVELGAAQQDADEAHTLMLHYWVRYGTANAGYPSGSVIVQVEQEWRAELGGGDVSARADTLLLMQDEVYIVDHKTRASKLPAEAERQFQLRPQFLRLCALWRKLNPTQPRASVWVNALIKTKLPGFERKLVRIGDDMLDKWEENHSRVVALMQAGAAGAMQLPANFSECAPAFGGECWGRDYCWGSDAVRERKYRSRDAAE